MKKFIIMALMALGIIGMWLVDVGEVIGSLGDVLGISISASNGFWSLSPSKVYHMGMYAATAVIFTLGCMAMHYQEKLLKARYVAARYKRKVQSLKKKISPP